MEKLLPAVAQTHLSAIVVIMLKSQRIPLPVASHSQQNRARALAEQTVIVVLRASLSALSSLHRSRKILLKN
ncbi:MAG TPA: hypothetical protein DDZ90_05285 [Planctomycetaceae bacterium]|nr:hypothetical protein [Gimesia sp.]HBL42789.1 hypothetical protein [Planctomycetaceae bacterium]